MQFIIPIAADESVGIIIVKAEVVACAKHFVIAGASIDVVISFVPKDLIVA